MTLIDANNPGLSTSKCPQSESTYLWLCHRKRCYAQYEAQQNYTRLHMEHRSLIVLIVASLNSILPGIVKKSTLYIKLLRYIEYDRKTDLLLSNADFFYYVTLLVVSLSSVMQKGKGEINQTFLKRINDNIQRKMYLLLQ